MCLNCPACVTFSRVYGDGTRRAVQPSHARMNFVRSTAAVTIPLILAATAWISPDGSTSSPGFAHALLALMAFGLMLNNQMSMGFLFVILSLGRLSWRDSLLMADRKSVV